MERYASTSGRRATARTYSPKYLCPPHGEYTDYEIPPEALPTAILRR
jgi:hypothetical protein